MSKDKSKWIILNEGSKRLYVLIHDDPAIHERFSIERVYTAKRKAPRFLIHDKLGRKRGMRGRLSDAQYAIQKCLLRESIEQDIRIVVHNEWTRGESERALNAIVDHFEKRLLEQADRFMQKIDELRSTLRSV